MNNQLGYIALHRATLDSDVFDMPAIYLKVWIWLLCQADFRTGTMTCTNLQARQALGSGGKLASTGTVCGAFQWLEKQGMIKRESFSKRNFRGTLITICNYRRYQDKRKNIFSDRENTYRTYSTNPAARPPQDASHSTYARADVIEFPKRGLN